MRSNTPEPSRLPLEFTDDLDYTTIIKFAEPLAGLRGSG